MPRQGESMPAGTRGLAQAGKQAKLVRSSCTMRIVPSIVLFMSMRARLRNRLLDYVDIESQDGTGTERPYQIVISYRVDDTGEGGDGSVFAILDELERAGYCVFVGERSIHGGDNWQRSIQTAIREADIFCPLCSPDYGNTDWTMAEIMYAISLKKQ